MNLTETIESALSHDRVDAAAAALPELLRAPDRNAALKELGGALAPLYASPHQPSVLQFLEAAAAQLSEDEVKLLTFPFAKEHELTRQWTRRLDDLAAERLANEVVEFVKASDMPRAEESAAALIALGTTPGQRTARAKQVATILGGLLYEKDRAQKLLASVSLNSARYGTEPDAAAAIQEEYQRSAAAAVKRERPLAAMARTELTQAAVELGRALPGRMAIHEPNPDDYENFRATMAAIMRACLASYHHNKFHEATLLMVEFAPKEISAAGAMAGVEQRLYLTLGRTARTVAAKVFAELGADPAVFGPYFEFTKRNLSQRIGRYCIESLGLLRNRDSADFLVSTMNDRKLGLRHEAMGALWVGGDTAQKALVGALQSAAGGRVVEGEQRRDAIVAIGALGRLMRGLDVATRSRLIAQVLRIVPQKDTELLVRSILAFFAGKLDDYDPALLKWAAQVATTSLWTVDRPELARAARNAPLGFRQPLLDLMERLAPFAMQTICATVEACAKTYSSGAYLAFGEFCAKVADPQELPALRLLMLNTFLHDDTVPQSAYNRQMVLDAATEQQAEISKDKVLASLVYAVDKIGNEEAQAALADLFDQIQSGRLPRPGKETADILFQAHLKSGRGKATLGAQPQPGEEMESHAASAAPAQVSADDLALIAELKGTHLLASKRRQKKVSAMVGLAQRKVVGALPLVIDHLTDKDPIVAAAAGTALMDYGSPPVSPHVQGHLVDTLVAVLEKGPDPVKVKLVDVLQRLGPRRSPLKERLEAFAAKPGLNLATKSVLARLIQPPAPAAAAPPRQAEATGDEPAAPAPKPGGAPAPKPAAAVSALDQKRAYMLARQEWIKGGKRGPEPKPPE
jgi:hypothetical protein